MFHFSPLITCLDKIIGKRRPYRDVLFSALASERIAKSDQKSFSSLLRLSLNKYYLLDFALSDVLENYKSKSREAYLSLLVLCVLRFDDADEKDVHEEFKDAVKEHRLLLDDEDYQAIKELSVRKHLLSEEVKKHPYLYNAINLKVPQFLLEALVQDFGTKNAPDICLSLSKSPQLFSYPLIENLDEENFKEIPLSEDDHIYIVKDKNKALTLSKRGELLLLDYSDAYFLSKIKERSLGMRVLFFNQSSSSASLYFASKLSPYKGEVTSSYLSVESYRIASDLVKKTKINNFHHLFSEQKLVKTYEPYESFEGVVYKARDTLLADTSIAFSILPSLTKEDFERSRVDSLIGLEEACRFVSKDGILLFYNRSLIHLDSKDVITSFLKKHPDFNLVEEDYLFPYQHESKGGYYCLLRRQA